MENRRSILSEFRLCIFFPLQFSTPWSYKREEYQASLLSYDLGPALPPPLASMDKREGEALLLYQMTWGGGGIKNRYKNRTGDLLYRKHACASHLAT